MPQCGKLLLMLRALMCFLALLASSPASTSPPALPSFDVLRAARGQRAGKRSDSLMLRQDRRGSQADGHGEDEAPGAAAAPSGEPLAHVLPHLPGPEGLAELPRVAASFATRGDARGEVYTRVNLYRLLFNAGRVEEAGARGGPNGPSRPGVRRSRADRPGPSPQGPASLGYRPGSGGGLLPAPTGGTRAVPKGSLFRSEGMPAHPGKPGPRARPLPGRSRSLPPPGGAGRQKRDLYAEANARYGMARAVLDQTAELPSEEGRSEAARLARRRSTPRSAAKNGTSWPMRHLGLGVLSKGEEARRHFDACLAAADTPWPTRATASTAWPACSPRRIPARRRRRSTGLSSSPVKRRTPGP